MDDFEKEIKFGFLEEAKELLANAEQCFLNLEKAKDDPSIIEQIFRLAHNLKGSAGAVGFTDLKDFTHSLESLLLKIKNRELQISSEIINLLLKCSDYLVEVFSLLKENLEARHDNPGLSAEIEAYLSGEQATTKAVRVQTASTEEVPRLTKPLAIELVEDLLPELENSVGSAKEPGHSQKKGSQADESVRVSLQKIDHLLNIMGELVILQTVMDQQKQHAHSALMQKTIGQMSKIIREAQSLSMGLRMLPLKQTFQKMQRIVRDTSKVLEKEVDFAFFGEDTELDKTVIEQLSDPLVHLIRNAVDHGLETASERQEAGKGTTGQIQLSAYQRGGQIIIEIKDDGRGLDENKLIGKAKEKGLLGPNESLSQEEVYKLIFAPGFSTKDQVTDVSGRGVGMDVVRTNISAMQGDIEVTTELGKGTCFRVILPLTLAIIDSMVVAVNEERYVVPISQVHESIRPKSEDLSTINTVGEVLILRGQPIPLYRLDRLLKRRSKDQMAAESGIALVCRDEGQSSFAILVNDIINQQQVVIKSLGEEIKGFPGITGAAILGDGKTSLIIDLFELTHPMRNNTKNKTNELRGAA